MAVLGGLLRAMSYLSQQWGRTFVMLAVYVLCTGGGAIAATNNHEKRLFQVPSNVLGHSLVIRPQITCCQVFASHRVLGTTELEMCLYLNNQH